MRIVEFLKEAKDFTNGFIKSRGDEGLISNIMPKFNEFLTLWRKIHLKTKTSLNLKNEKRSQDTFEEIRDKESNLVSSVDEILNVITEDDILFDEMLDNIPNIGYTDELYVDFERLKEKYKEATDYELF